MSDEGTLTIMFRGLMVSHVVTQEDGQSFYEIGVLPAKDHHLRIHTIKKGEGGDADKVIGVFDLCKLTGASNPRRWELKVDAPARPGIHLRINSSQPLDRQNSTDTDDFRWIIDLDAPDFYPDFPAPGVVSILDTTKFRPLLRVNHGEIFTSEKARVLRKRESEPKFNPFGSVAGSTGCNIQIEEGGVHLVDETGALIFSARSAPGIYYEFVNTPPEPFVEPDPHPHEHPQDHFQFYYQAFPPSTSRGVEKFQFQEITPPPGSRPHLCGGIFLSKSTDPFK